MRRKRFARWAERLAGAAALAPVLYLAIGLVVGSVPVNADRMPPAAGVRAGWWTPLSWTAMG